ncbi:CRINKLY4 related 3 [Euphorbia peplus]|nr:CRINKLY4 related 3 [Euphorbia peplus]
MTKLPFSPSIIILLTFLIFFTPLPLKTQSLGSGATVAVTSTSATVCGIIAGNPVQKIVCYKSTTGEITIIQPDISFSSISGGENFFCGLISGAGAAFFCWNTFNLSDPKRVYFNPNSPLHKISVGGDQICGILNNTAAVKCWRGDYYSSGNRSPAGTDQFHSISSGYHFTCGILIRNSRIRCWGSDSLASKIESQFGGISMVSIEAGGYHVCGFNLIGLLVCKGENSAGQCNIPVNTRSMYSQLGLGGNHSCAIRRDGSVVCWGGGGKYNVEGIENVSFELVVSGNNFSCGLVSRDFSMICWGPGWTNSFVDDYGAQIIPFSDQILPGRCVQSDCEGRVFPNSDRLCFGSGNICYPPSRNFDFL